jgi:uncharacterized protein (TIGR02996 family)
MSRDLGKAFLADICANPDDDAPRLIYADWLQEQGDEDSAEFIRVQIERSRLPEWDARQVRLRLREEALLKEHQDEWLAGLPAMGHGWDGSSSAWKGFRRGFPAVLSGYDYELLRDRAGSCAAATPVESASFHWPRPMDGAEPPPLIPGLRELYVIGEPYSETEVAIIADSPLMSTVRVLKLGGRSMGHEDVGLRRMLASPYAGRLTAVRIASYNLGNAGIRAIAAAEGLTSLEELDLTSSGGYTGYHEDPVIQAAGVEALARWPGLARLRRLTLSGSDLRRGGLRALLRSPHVGGLKELTLRRCRLDGRALAEFGSAHEGLRLEVLDLGENVIKEAGPGYLALAGCLSDLKVLRLDRCEIPLGGARELAKAPFLAGLRILDVGFNNFGPKGLEVILGQAPPALHTLRLRANDLFDKGAVALANSPASDGLLEVDLSDNSLSVPATEALGATAHLTALLVLHIHGNPLGEAAARALAASPLGRRLAVLELAEPPAEEGIPF